MTEGLECLKFGLMTYCSLEAAGQKAKVPSPVIHKGRE